MSKTSDLSPAVTELRNVAKSFIKIADLLNDLFSGSGDLKEAAQPETKPVTMEMVRAKLAALMQAGKQAEVKALLQKHGGKKLSDIPEENFPALLKDAGGV